MRATYVNRNIKRAFQTVKPVIAASHPDIAARCVRIEADETGMTQISATDMFTTLSIKINSNVYSTGTVFVDGKVFTDFISSVPTVNVELDTDDNDNVLVEMPSIDQYGVASFNARFNAINVDNFPAFDDLDTAGDRVSLVFENPNDLISILKRVSVCIADTNIHPMLTGMNVNIKDGVAAFVGTDGYRLSLDSIECDVSVDDEVDITIPKSVIAHIQRMHSKDTTKIEIDIYAEKSMIVISFSYENGDTSTITSGLISGDYPQYKSLIPDEYTSTSTVDIDDLNMIANHTRSIARENPVAISTKHGMPPQISFSVQNGETGVVSRSESIVEISGKLEKTGIKSEFLYDAAKMFKKSHADSKTIISINEGAAPIMFMSPEYENYKHFVMPMALLQSYESEND